MKKPIATSLLLLLTLSLSVQAQPLWEQLQYRGENYAPKIVDLNGKAYYSFNDPELQRLLGLCTSQLQWSSSGQTLYVFTPGRESFWSHDSETVRVNGQEMTSPGRLIITETDHLMEPAALFYALSLRPYAAENGGFQLVPMVTGIEVTRQAGEMPKLLLRSSSPTRPQTADNDDGSLTLDMGQMAWGGDEREFWRDEVFVRVEGGNGGEEPLKLHLVFPANWKGRIDNSSLLNDVKLVLEPSFPVSEYAPEVNLVTLEQRPVAEKKQLVLSLDRPVRYFWNYDERNRFLTLEIPHVANHFSTELPLFLENQRIEVVSTERYPVLRIQGVVPEGSVPEFRQFDDSSHTLAVALGSSEQRFEARGSAALKGYAVARGTIVIDPGHGGSDPGCLNRGLGVREADVTLAISKQLATILRDQGWRVVLTRETDRDVTYAGSPDKMELMARSEVANQINADIFISIHCNASYSSHHSGSSIHWYKAEDYQLAQSLEFVLGTSIGLGQKGLIRNRFVVLRYAEMPSVLVETAYLTNPYEGARLSNPEFQKVIANQLAGGLASYVQGRYAQKRLLPTE